ncbi:MAG TPA: DUF2877 domain-containing protein [Candidatus Acetothermia bacterium]|nr:DUF2877 domain-containing protein [Candidatus Acetothermia bacterium]
MKEAAGQLRAGIQKSAHARTSLPSTQMLLAACDRSFAEPILALLGGLASKGISESDFLERAERIAQLGHYSGIAILSGLRLVLRAHGMSYFATDLGHHSVRY